MPLTTLERINVGRLSALYTSNELASGRLQGGQIDKRLPHLIYAVTQGLVWANELLETTANLNKIGNYLISICRHDLRAQGVLSLDNGGTVAPISGGGVTIEDLDFIVSALSYIATGESGATFDGTGGNPDLRGYNVDFARNGTMQYTTPQAGGALYYSWNSVTGLFQLLSTDPLVNPAAQVGESFRIMPDATSGTSSSSSVSTWRRLVITSSAFEPDGVTCNLATIVGSTYTLTVIGFNQEPQFAGVFFNYSAGGFQIIWPSFNAANFGNIIIDKID